MKIIEYLTADKKFSFTVNTAADSVNIVVPSGGAIFLNGGQKGTFKAGDSHIVMSYGLMLPENFTFFMQGVGLPIMELEGLALAGVPYAFYLPAFGSTNRLQNIVEENKEMEVDAYNNYSTFVTGAGLVKEDYQIKVGAFFNTVISMLNVPAAANGKEYFIVPFLKVAHNIALS
jgi:hypothetical protein